MSCLKHFLFRSDQSLKYVVVTAADDTLLLLVRCLRVVMHRSFTAVLDLISRLIPLCRKCLFLFISISDTIIQGKGGRLVVPEKRPPPISLLPSGPIEVRDCLISQLINRFSRGVYRCTVYCPGASQSISICSLNLGCLIYAFFLFFCDIFLPFFLHCVYSIGRNETGFVRQGALCCQQQESKIVSEDGAVKE